ncbi:MAG: methyltransferase domain-containing protein [Chloroflexota bacterium]
MIPKPKHLGPKYGEQFKDASIVAAYKHRPLYPAETFDILDELIVDEPRRVLDIGCGSGSVARYLIDRVDHIDAVDISSGMIEAGKQMPNGNHPNLNWIVDSAEDVPLEPPYALIMAGQSLHWLDWYTVMPRFAQLLTPNGVLALVTYSFTVMPWIGEVLEVIGRLSTNREFEPYNLVEELEKRALFTKMGERLTTAVTFTQPIDDAIESWHSSNGLSRDRMSAEAAAEFDHEIHAIMIRHCPDGQVPTQLQGKVVWGKPHEYSGTANE